VAQADLQLITHHYHCERGVEIPVTNILTDGESAVVLWVEGRQISLRQETSASGTRYAWPSDGAGYVWWTRGPEATLYWKEDGVELPLLICNESS
jgi:membrane-bound inhibitor of C-type lysozyme